MLSAQKIRSLVLKLSKNSAHAPDYYFILGYFIGIGMNPAFISTSLWLETLFGDLNELADEELQAVIELYNQQMNKIMEGKLKLPAQCVLSKTDIESSLQPLAPLPQWCLGMLAGLKLINVNPLNEAQVKNIEIITKILTGFTCVEQAEKIFYYQENYQQGAQEQKRLLSMHISNLAYEMRFNSEILEASLSTKQEGEEGEFEALIQMLIGSDDPELRPLLDNVIAQLESDLGKEFINENSGHLWMLHDARPYMLLRSRRAELNFKYRKVNDAISELQALIKLNSNDNQANRYPLANYLVTKKRWLELSELLKVFDEPSSFMLAVRALMAFSEHGDSPQANAIKKKLKAENKYIVAYLTGQKKAPKESPEFYQPGEKTEVFMYLMWGGKEAWRSIEGSLFWLRRK